MLIDKKKVEQKANAKDNGRYDDTEHENGNPIEDDQKQNNNNNVNNEMSGPEQEERKGELPENAETTNPSPENLDPNAQDKPTKKLAQQNQNNASNAKNQEGDNVGDDTNMQVSQGVGVIGFGAFDIL